MAYARSLTKYETQRDWYSRRASELKKRAQLADLCIIGIGALTAAVPSLIAEGYAPRLLSVPRMPIAVLQGRHPTSRGAEPWPDCPLATGDV